MQTKAGGPNSWVRVTILSLSAVVVMCALSACGSSSSSSSSASNAKFVADTGNPKKCSSLGLFTWEGEAPASVIKPFEKQYGVPVKVSYITSGAQALAKMAAGGTRQYAVIFAAPETTQPMQEAGVIKPIDPTKFAEYSKLFKFSTKTFEYGGKTYALSEDWGVNPFIYNTQVIKTPPTSWAALWTPEYKGQVALWEDYSMLWIGASVLGYDKDPSQLFHLTSSQLTAIKNKMLELKGNVRTVWNSGGNLIQLFSTHEVAAAQGWSYVYNQLTEKHQPVALAKVKDMGAQGWTEGASISSGVSPDCEAAAYAFLNWTVSPKGAAALAESSGYSPSNPEAAKYLSPALVKTLGLDNPQAFLGSAIFKQAVSNPSAYNQTMQEVIAGLK